MAGAADKKSPGSGPGGQGALAKVPRAAGGDAHLFLNYILPVDAEEEPVLHHLLGIARPPAEPGQRWP